MHDKRYDGTDSMWMEKIIICLCKSLGTNMLMGRLRTATMMIKDIEEQICKEEDQKEILERELLLAQDANRAKSTFLSNISHDIRTPLNAILGLVNLARQEELTDKMSEYLDQIQLSGRYLLSLCNEIIEMSQIESGKSTLSEQNFSMDIFLQSICRLLQTELARKGHTLQFSGKGLSNVHVLGDERQLGKVLLNVLENAIKYTPDGGKIRFDAYEKNSIISGEIYFEFLIEDEGIGMDEECLRKIFIPFERGKETRDIPGSGLGMSIVKGIVEQMNGTIEVESRPGEGTQVKIALHLRKAMEPEYTAENKNETYSKFIAEGKKKNLHEIAGADKKILLVEDNLLNRKIAEELIGTCGAKVTTAESGEQALEILQSKRAQKERFDLIFMDVQLSGQDGYEITRIIRKMEADDSAELRGEITPIIAVTANAFPKDMSRAMAAGMNDYLVKPIEIEALTAILVKWLDL